MKLNHQVDGALHSQKLDALSVKCHGPQDSVLIRFLKAIIFKAMHLPHLFLLVVVTPGNLRVTLIKLPVIILMTQQDVVDIQVFLKSNCPSTRRLLSGQRELIKL